MLATTLSDLTQMRIGEAFEEQPLDDYDQVGRRIGVCCIHGRQNIVHTFWEQMGANWCLCACASLTLERLSSFTTEHRSFSSSNTLQQRSYCATNLDLFSGRCWHCELTRHWHSYGCTSITPLFLFSRQFNFDWLRKLKIPGRCLSAVCVFGIGWAPSG